MGQTLTHGVYLPDEGERNCYNGLAANWQILDTSVGTIAAHTAALAGKAPLVHTHTKSDITDFPAYGTTAGTICEGNDSRLSDARTPVAHTHSKADITDLFNSANTWSGTNSFTAANININSSNFSLGDTVSSNQVKRFQWYDASSNRYACIAVNYATDKSVWVDIPLRTKNTEGTSFVDKGIRFQVKPDNTSAFLPVTNSVTDLGTSTNKWKTFNGINPGALSLPTTDSTKWVDLSGSIIANNSYTYTPAVDGWVSVELKKPNMNPVAIYIEQGSVKTGCYGSAPHVTDGDFYGSACMPVRANIAVNIYARGANSVVTSAYFMPCQGNV